MISLPSIPLAKEYIDKMTPEQKVLTKCINSIELDNDDENTLRECIAFYKGVFPLLKSIDLASLNEDQINILESYLNQVFSFEITVTNLVDFNLLFRVSVISESFLEKGKVRTPKYLTYPPLEIVKSNGVYNRANSFSRTVFYASFYENVALRETKLKVGDRIIISTWRNITNLPFNSYAIANSNVNNEGVSKATQSLLELREKLHPLFAELMNIVLAFLASEFVKEIEFKSAKKYEYLYSAYFSEKILSLHSEENPEASIDFIIYPSVAWKHVHDNVAVHPDSVDRKLKLIQVREFDVISTNYDIELEPDETPVQLKFIRNSDWIEKDMIVWDDD
jgi:hypothetical protein